MVKITRDKEVPVFSNFFGTLFNDEITGARGHKGNYLRWKWAHAAVAVIPYDNQRGVALARMYRYPISDFSLEFPRGGLNPGEEPGVGALREMREETGLIGSSSTVLGSIFADSGLIQSPISVVAVRVSLEDIIDHGDFEAIEKKYWVTEDEFLQNVRNGEITCSITISCFSLFQLSRRAL